MKQKMKRIISLSLIICLCFNFTCFAYTKSAAEPKDEGKTVAELNGYTEEEWAKISDNNLEYPEIQERVHNFNPSIANGWDQYTDSMQSIQISMDIMANAKKKAQENYDSTKAQLDAMGVPAQMQESTLSSMKQLVTLAGTYVTSYDSTLKKMKKNSSYNTTLRSAERQLTTAVQQVMMGYCAVRANKKILENLVQTYQESLTAYQAMASVGMATSTDILIAQSGYLSAVSNLATLTVTEQQLYGQLMSLCGWKASDVVNVGEVPDPDMNRIATMNPATDADTAILKSSELSELWQSDHSRSSSGANAMNGLDSQMQANIRANMQTLYADVLGAKAAYEGAQAGYESSKIAGNAADAQYQLGLTSKAQYLGARIAALQGEADMITARDNLEQAILKYEAAVDGDCSAE